MGRFFTLGLALVIFGCSDTDSDVNPSPPANADAALPVDQGTAADADLAADMGTPPDAQPADMETPTIQVGYRETSLTYTPRGAAAPRTLSVSLWYPTHDTAGDFTAYQSIFVRDDVYGNAAPVITASTPVMIFSHGRCGFSQYSFFLTEYFARSGWLVAAPDHTGDVLNIECTEQGTAAIFEQRPQDISAVIDFLGSLPDDDALANAAVTEVAMVGHSFGGYTGLVASGAQFAVEYLQAACGSEENGAICDDLAESATRLAEGYHDPRIKVHAAMAPGDYRILREGVADIDIPTLLMTASSDLNNPNEVDGDPIWAQLDGPSDRRVRFDRAGHFTFTSICTLTGARGVDNGCSDNMVAPEDFHPVINTYVMAFLRRHLLGDETGGALLDGEESIHEHVTVVVPEPAP